MLRQRGSGGAPTLHFLPSMTKWHSSAMLTARRSLPGSALGASRAGHLSAEMPGPTDLGPDGHALTVPVAEHVVDTTAAGDSFNAGYLAAAAAGRSSIKAMESGHALALKVIGRRGAIVDID